MVNVLERLFGSVVSALAYCFFNYHHQEDHHHQHPKSANDNNINYNMPKAKARSLSLQAINLIEEEEEDRSSSLFHVPALFGIGVLLGTVELKVRMCCTGCERVVKDAIHKLRGVDSVDVELDMEKVTVIGYVDRNKVLKAVRRAGKRAEFWPYPNPPLYFTSTNNYFKDTSSEYKESYNYWRHGYNAADKHGSLPVTHRGDDKVSNLFNDDNVNACCLM